MAKDIQSKQASPATPASPANEAPMPTYEYQKDDARSFGVSYKCQDEKSTSANATTLKVF